MAIEQPTRTSKSSAAAWLLGGGIVVAGLAVVTLVRPWQNSAQQQPTQQQGEAIVQSETTAQTLTTVNIPVEGMSCGSCAASVKRATKAIAGVKDVEVDLVGRRAKVAYEAGKTSPEQVSAAIAELGYKVGTPAVESNK